MNYYGTLEGVNEYHQARFNVAWLNSVADDEQKVAALIRASSVIDGVYGDRFGGVKSGGRLQVLSWPRSGAIDNCANEAIPDDEVPMAVINAAYELALIELESPGSSAPVVTLGRITKSEKVDSISREFFDTSGSVDSMRPVLLAVEDSLKCVLSKKSGGSVCLVRY